VYGVVPAAGRGTRLGPLTDDRPKALLEVGDRPLLTHVFETLEPHVEAYVVVVGYLGEQLREYYGESYEGVPITYVEQSERRGLAHAILQTEPVVDAPFVQLNGDNVLRGNVGDVIATHRDSGADATLLVERVSREQAMRGGVLELEGGESGKDGSEAGDIDGGETGTRAVVGLVEKPAEPPSRLATTGCFAFSPRIFEACAAIDPSERGEYELPDAIAWLLRHGGTVKTVRLEGWRVNVNTTEDIRRVADRL
jgi:glucose-1-phosphate thymidylyltransferase